jgi:hypothetical protein
LIIQGNLLKLSFGSGIDEFNPSSSTRFSILIVDGFVPKTSGSLQEFSLQGWVPEATNKLKQGIF